MLIYSTVFAEEGCLREYYKDCAKQTINQSLFAYFKNTDVFLLFWD
jgi:hypothetical protein